MKLIETSVFRPIGVATAAMAVIALGWVAMGRLAVDLLPEIDFPRVSITTLYDGVAPQEIETLLTRPIEQAMSTLEGVEKLESTSAEGISRVQLQFNWGVSLEQAVNDVRALLDRVVSRLPEGVDRPVVYKFNLADAPIAFLSLSGPGDPRHLRYLAEETLSRRIERIPGIAAADVRGGRPREIRVELDADRLVALRLSPQEVAQTLTRENRNVSVGNMLEQGREVVVRSVGEYETVEQIARTVVARRDGSPVYLADVGSVIDDVAELTNFVWIDRDPGMRLRIAKQSGANTIRVAEQLRREVEAINRDYEGRLHMAVLWDSSVFIEQAVNNVRNGALAGAALAIFVLLFFLRNLRSTLVIATAIPISIMATFGLMYFYGYSLNIISFGGLALAVGMLVDNAIVILENIYRRREMGDAVTEAAVAGAGEVTLPVIAGTLTTMAVFVPVMFMSGFAGVFFQEMAVVVSFGLFCSLAVAVTLVPALAAQLLGRERQRPLSAPVARLSAWAERGYQRIEDHYSRLLDRVLRRPGRVVLAALGLLAGALALTPLLGIELMPEADEGGVRVDVEYPVGTPVERTMELIRQVEASVLSVLRPDELEHVMTMAGPENWWQTTGGNEGRLELTLSSASARGRSADEISVAIREALGEHPASRIRVRTTSSNVLMRLMRGGEDRLAVEIRGFDLDTADALGRQVLALMRDIPGVADVRIDREEGKPEQVVRLNRDRIADLGLRTDEVATALEHYVLGRVATRFRDGSAEYDMRVRMGEIDRRYLDQLADLPIVLPGGTVVPLGAVAELESRTGPAAIRREGQERLLVVGGGIEGRPLGDVVVDVRERLRELSVPSGFSVGLGGEYAEQQQTFSDLQVGLLLALLLVFAVMAVQFESWRHPLVVMSAIPFSFVGVILTLVLTGTSFNMNSFLGTIVLIGVVVNNAIIFVDYVNLLRRRDGWALDAALRETGRRRLRPILMTTATTVLAMLPLALGIGEGAEVQAPLGRAIVGGLLVSTAVTLLLVPSLYLLWARREKPLAPPRPAPSGDGAATAAP